MKSLWERLSDIWCHHMHDAAMWPAHGKYQCRVCFREYPVQWANGVKLPAHRACGPCDGHTRPLPDCA